jgi:hypothetical protein
VSAYVHFKNDDDGSGSTFPSPNTGELGWRLIHGGDTVSRTDRARAASIIEAYAYLINEASAKRRAEVVRKLKTSHPKERRPHMSTWQPIETVPKDGREVLLEVELRAGIRGRCLVGPYRPGGHCIEDHPPIDAGWYFWNGSMFDRAAKPTRWMPLPETDSHRGSTE